MFKAFSIFDIFYRGADKSLARPTSRCILFDGENISFDTSLVIYRVSIKSFPAYRHLLQENYVEYIFFLNVTTQDVF